MPKYRLVYDFIPAKDTINKSHDMNYSIQRRVWFLCFPYWEEVGLIWKDTPLEAYQFEDKLNFKSVRTGEFF